MREATAAAIARAFARVLFDEAHGEAWSIRPEAAARMRPEHPAAASYADAAGELAARDFTSRRRSRAA